MKAVYIIKSKGAREVIECDSVQNALQLGQQDALAIGSSGVQNVTLEVYELVATGNVQTTSTIKIEKAVKP